MNVYELVNQRIVELLENGQLPPWKRSWNAETNMPKNLVSNREYHGVNVWLLSQQYSSPYWLTFKQATQDKGGHIRKGEKASLVVFWKWLDRTSSSNADTGEAEVNGASKGKIPMLRYYNVFNLEQTEGIEAPPAQETHNIFTPIEKAEQIVAGMPMRPDIRHGGNKAAYSPMLDFVKMPEKHTFSSEAEYYCCLYHELVHSSGHAKRLNRKGITEASYFGSHEYSKEECVAEMGAAFLCGMSGIEQKTLENSAAYIRGWLKALKDDKTLLVMASSQGQKAADYILNKQEEHTELDEAA